MRDFLKETIEILADYGKKLSDIKFFTNGVYNISVTDFIKEAENFEYDAGFGTNYINDQLVGVGDTFLLIRKEYDGAEHWDYTKLGNAFARSFASKYIIFSTEGLDKKYPDFAYDTNPNSYPNDVNWRKFN